jgi:hypothetical protein
MTLLSRKTKGTEHTYMIYNTPTEPSTDPLEAMDRWSNLYLQQFGVSEHCPNDFVFPMITRKQRNWDHVVIKRDEKMVWYMLFFILLYDCISLLDFYKNCSILWWTEQTLYLPHFDFRQNKSMEWMLLRRQRGLRYIASVEGERNIDFFSANGHSVNSNGGEDGVTARARVQCSDTCWIIWNGMSMLMAGFIRHDLVL